MMSLSAKLRIFVNLLGF